MTLTTLAIAYLSICFSVYTTSGCDAGWQSNGGRCYLFSTIFVDFLTGQDFCVQKGGNLVHINNAAENNFLKGVVSLQKEDSWWIGLRDIKTEGLFQWVDDDTNQTFSDWQPGQPDNHGLGEDCATLYKYYIFKWDWQPGQPDNHGLGEDCATLYKYYNFKWGDYYCTSQAGHPICEKADTA